MKEKDKSVYVSLHGQAAEDYIIKTARKAKRQAKVSKPTPKKGKRK